jgi:Fe(3+) dicitrate transport protein
LKIISKHTAIIYLTFLSSFCFSQEVKLSVFSKKDSTIVKSVTFFNTTTSKEYISNVKGQLVLKVKESSFFTLFSKGFFTKTISVNPGQNQNIYLIPKSINLREIEVRDQNKKEDVSPLYLRKIEKMFVYHAKKTERIKLSNVDANLATNNVRQAYNKIAGLNSFQTSSSGLGTEIGVRGLSPERSSNLNIRQNGYDISADALGYPDAYYVPPLESVDIIESVRGAGALQYGTQFGGMINYRLKTCDFDTNKIGVESRQTIGQYNFFNSYNAVYGKQNKFSFYSFFSYKEGDDWKVNSQFSAKNAFFQGKYDFNEKFSVNLEFMHYYYLAKQPGGLTDALFNDDPSQSIRDRNWFSVSWNLPSVTFKYNRNSKTEYSSKFFGLIANRKALGFLGNITRIDNLGNRDFLLDNYLNIGNETKFLKRYTIHDHLNVLVAGFRVYRGNTRKRQGEGNDKYVPDFTYNNPNNLEGSDYIFPNYNAALFTENIFYVNDKLSFTTGIRGEYITTNAEGYYRNINTDLAGNVILDTSFIENKNKVRSFVLLSLGVSYEFSDKIQAYGNFSQNYRAINFNDLRITNPNFRVDENLSDETGYNADIGVRGTVGNFFSYDVSLFYLKYNNRIGFILKTDPNLFNTYRFRTNISESRNLGIESVVELDFLKLFNRKSKYALKYFVNYSYVDGRYINSQEPAYENKKVELIPNTLLKTGVSTVINNFTLSYQFSYTSQQYTDATNSTFSSNAISGLIPTYYLMDVSASYKHKKMKLEVSLNNITNEVYFNRRAVGYPGPGIIAAPPRMFYLTLGLTL